MPSATSAAVQISPREIRHPTTRALVPTRVATTGAFSDATRLIRCNVGDELITEARHDARPETLLLRPSSDPRRPSGCCRLRLRPRICSIHRTSRTRRVPPTLRHNIASTATRLTLKPASFGRAWVHAPTTTRNSHVDTATTQGTSRPRV